MDKIKDLNDYLETYFEIVGGIMDYCLVPQKPNRDIISRLQDQLF